MARNVTDQLRVLAEEKLQSLTILAHAPVHTVGDAALLRHALTNLIHNAIKYTPTHGAITVDLKTMQSGEAAIEVQDTGPGVPAAHRALVFERFYRVDASRSSEGGGVGLGLAIARWAVEANGGRIGLASDERNGSLFRVLLPATDKASCHI